MKNQQVIGNGSKGKTLSRRKLLGVGAAASAAAVAGLAAPSLAGVASAKSDGRRMTVRVEDARITPNVLGDPSATYFLVVGDITQVDGESATGKFYCRGVFTDPALANTLFGTSFPPLLATPPSGGLTFVEQRFKIDGQGTIIGSGDEGDPPLAVVGGTGRFTGVHGSYTPSGGPLPVASGTIDFTFGIRRG
jgi:hypothetical protein